MSLVWDNNNAALTGAQAIFKLRTLLVGAGWSVFKAGDGIGSTTVSSGSSGANGLGNTNAYLVLQAPSVGGTTRQILMQRGSTNLLWLVRYSWGGLFTGGSATVAPTATDQQNVRNNNAANNLFAGADNSYRFNAVADNASPYGFLISAFPIGGGTSNGGFGMLPVSSPDTGEVDPYVFYCNRGVAEAWGVGELNGGFSGWIRKGQADQRWYDDPGFGTPGIKGECSRSNAGVTVIPGGLAVNPHTGFDDVFPIPCGVQTGSIYSAGFKGVISSSLLAWNGPTKAAGDTLDTNGGSKNRMAISATASMAWDGSSPLV